MTAVEARLDAAFAAAGVRGRLHAIDVDGDAEVALDADDLVVQASVFKVPILVELCRRAAEGGLDLADRVRVPAGGRTLGSTGLSVLLDDLDLSLRDLAVLMMSISDNHATDVLIDRLGLEAINATMRAAGFPRTVLAGDCRYLWQTMEADLGSSYGEHLAAGDGRDGWAAVRAMRAVTPAATTHTTPRETTGLLRALWRDERFPATACAEVRRVLSLQAWPHRLAAGFPEEGVRIGAKTGTIAHLRCEAGVVERPGDGRYAVAVFVEAPTPASRNPAADLVIGTAARVAVDHLSARRRTA